MSKTLVLITTAFPFGRGEQFLESEVDILATQFDRIVVVPQKKTGEARSLPENFFVDKGFATLVSKDGALKRVALAIFYWAKNNNIFPLKSADIKSYLVASYYAYRSGQYFYKLCESLRSKDGAVVFYSYWFYPVVVGLVDIKKKYKMDGLSIVTRAHGSDVYEAVHGISEFPFRRRVINCLARVFCISDNGAEHIRKKYGAKNVEVSRGQVFIVRAQRLDDLFQVTSQHLIKLMYRQSDTMIGHTILREVVGPDLFAPVPGPDLRLPILCDRRLLLFSLSLDNSRAQRPHSLGAVFEL